MTRLKYITVTILLDLLSHLIAWYLFYIVKFKLELIGSSTVVEPVMLFMPSLILGCYWVILFAFYGLYNNLVLISRLDEIIQVGKITLIGTLILFFFLFIDQSNWSEDNIGQAKYFAIAYWILLFLNVSFFRVILRSYQKYQTRKGIGLHRAVLVGTGTNAMEVAENLERNKILGLNVIGFVASSASSDVQISGTVLGVLSDLKQILIDNDINDVIVALENDESKKIIEVVDQIDIPNIAVKILPDFYQMIIGLNRTNQIFGLPLIDIMPDPMPSWEKFVKRLFDITISVVLLIGLSPIILLLWIVIPFSSKGKSIYSQVRVGLFSKNFTIYKFRTMYTDAESLSGPKLASQNDPRITPLGNLMRKTRLDELPQLWNVLKGDMSLVGPRPERPFFVDQFKKQIPLYSRRLRVKPGITGWAQVKWKYDETFDDVVEKTKYDLFYVENMSLRMDFKILVNTLSTVALGKGQ